jgi:hypothetical protein
VGKREEMKKFIAYFDAGRIGIAHRRQGEACEEWPG